MNLQTILWNTVAVECQGDGDLLNNLRIKNTHSGAESDLAVNGLFYAIGASTFSLLPSQIEPLQIYPPSSVSHPCTPTPLSLFFSMSIQTF